MENSIYLHIPRVEVLEKGAPKEYSFKDKNGNVIRSGKTFELKCNSAGFSGWIRCNEDIYNTVELRKIYDFSARMYENTTIKNLKFTDIIK